MGFRLNEISGSVLSSGSGLTSAASRLTGRLNTPKELDNLTEDKESLSRRVQAPRQDANNAKMFADIAEKASSAILSLRKEQYENAKLASESANPEQQSTLQSRNEELQTEIERIAGEAVFNGQNVLQGGSLSVAKDSEESPLVFNLSDISSISAATETDISSTAGAAAALDTLETRVKTANAANSSASSALNRAEQALSASITPADKSAGDIRDVEEAEAVAGQVREGILNKYAAEQEGLPAQGSIDREIVQSLLTE